MDRPPQHRRRRALLVVALAGLALTAPTPGARAGGPAASAAAARAEGPLVATLATAVAEYPALVTGVVPITDPLRHPEIDAGGRTLAAPRPWVSADGFHVDREACAWDAAGRPTAYRVAVPLLAGRGADRGPERSVAIHEADAPGRRTLEGWAALGDPADGARVAWPRVGLVLELAGGPTYRCALVDRGAARTRGAWIDRYRAWRRLEAVPEDLHEALASPPELLGVHAYVDRRADGLVVATVRLSNAAVGPDGSGAQGTVFLDALRVEHTEGWIVVWDETGGSLVDAGGRAPLVEAERGPYAFDARRQTVRRFALCRPGAERRAGRVLRGEAFARAEGPCSYLAGGWGSRGDRVPDYDRPPLRAAYRVGRTTGWRAVEVTGRQEIERLVDRLDAERPGDARRTRRFGLFHPVGSPERGEQGGWLVESAPGAGLVARNWMRRDRLLACLLAERMPVAFDPDTGAPLTAAQIARAHGGVFPYEIHLTGSWWYDKHELPWWREVEPVGEARELPALAALRRWAPIDVAHYGRAFTTAYAWALQSGDPLAADLVREAAARVEKAWTLEPTTREADGRKPDGWWADLTLGARLREARARPGQGLFSTRDLAWAIDCTVAAYRLTPPADAPRRAELERWLAAAARYVVAVQTPSGVCMARRARQEGGVWQSTLAPDPFRNGIGPEWCAAQWLEESLRVNACGSLVAHLADPELAAQVVDNVRRTARTMLAGMRELRRDTPPKWVCVQPGTERVMHPNYGGESFQSQSALWVGGVDRTVIQRMHGDGSARSYVEEVCRKVREHAPDLLAHAVPVLAAIVAEER